MLTARRADQRLGRVVLDWSRAMEEHPECSSGIPSVEILGVRIDRLDMESVIETIRGFIAGDGPRLVVTADAAGLVIAHDDPEFRELVNNADLVTPDSAGILIAARWQQTPLPARVSGVDIADRLCGLSATDGFSVFFFGSAPGVAELAAERLRERYPGLVVAGTRHGYFEAAREEEIVAEIRSSGASVLLVALGMPRQEKWIASHLHELGVKVAIGVGGSLDVFSGQVKRAPAWIQRVGCEWLYRLVQNPKKITKVLALPRFVWLVVVDRLSGGRLSRAAR